MKDFLFKLSLRMLNQDVGRVIEYLLRNFEVHRFESEELCLFFLPFHSENLYVRLLQNVNLGATKSFYFLEENMKKGLPIS